MTVEPGDEKADAEGAETFIALWDRAVQAHPDDVFLVFRGDGRTDRSWTYAEFDAAVDGAAGALRQRGVRRGSAIHLCLENSPAFVAVWLAASRLGAWIAPVDPTTGLGELRTQIARTAAAVTVTSRLRSSEICAALPAHPVIAVTGDGSDLAPGAALAGSTPHEASRARCEPGDRLAVMFTSGTTSQPKGVVLTQANYAYTALRMSQAAALQREHRWLVVLPLFHGNAQFYCFAAAIAAGASVALVSGFSASRWSAQARELGATHASLFAAPIRMILARRDPAEPPLSLSLVWFAQNLSAAQHAEFAQICGVKPRQLYGMTETTAVVTAQRQEQAGPETIGSVVAGRELVLVDPDTGEDTEPGPGVLTVLGRRGHDLFLEYLDAPEINARVFSERGGRDAFSTGDLVRRLDDGQLRFVGRVDDVVKVSGENVSLTEVEAALAAAPGVLEVAVVAVPDPLRDVVPHAFVVARDPARPPAQEALDEYASAHLPKAARPRAWTLVDSLPRTSVGKIRRFELKR
ncbi:class I adenylate-forming enzyme family protein [Brevibacterium album]|uniref:class I adenylate-forming enzyme family protein n=1 Tax=Brevibacterium album TaxID=417948 RepID=UPI00041A3DA5|nr:class I adenylate-forming enzyme family protein [Brevibacterium album]